MPKPRSSVKIMDTKGNVVAELGFRKECTPTIWLKKGYKFKATATVQLTENIGEPSGTN